MKRFYAFALVLCLCFSALISCEMKDLQVEETSDDRVAPQHAELNFSQVTDMSKVAVSDTETDYVLFDIANYGKILVRLYPEVAPATVANFKSLVAKGFYDGLIFHRVIENFMIQGGDPLGNGTGGQTDENGNELNIRGEFTSNGFENNLRHVRGVISMARANDPNSASSQFFICHQNYMAGNGKYAAFGYVVYGMDTVDAIAKVTTDENDKPKTDVVITSARFAKILENEDVASDRVAPKHEELDFSQVVDMSKVTLSDTETDYVLFDVANYGKILVRLYPDVAPATVANFKSLVAKGFYDGLIFHRVIENFMIQGGDPRGNGTGGQTDENGNKINIPGEFASNGFENNLSHVRGVLSMARANHPDSASSQFFICHQNYMAGNGKYAAFGYVVYGMDTVDAIATVETNYNDKPTTDIVITSVRFANVPAEAIEQ